VIVSLAVTQPTTPHRLLDVLAAGETDRGRKRESNEDTVLVRSDLGLYVVADGAGGHSAGNVASALATSEVARQFDATEGAAQAAPEIDAFGLWSGARRLSRAVQKGNQAVIELARSSNRYRGMGTTIVCALVVPDTGRLHVAHVGDSRCYRLRQGSLELLTPDHSILNDVVELHPEMDDAALAKLPRKAVTRALGMEERVRVAVRTLDALPGDRYLLCSDGVTGELGEAVLANLLGQAAAPADIVREVVRAANEVGGRDNVTALVVECRAAAPGAARVRAAPAHPVMAPVPAPAAARPRAEGSEPSIEVALLEEEARDPEIVVMRARGGADPAEPRVDVVPLDAADARTIQALDRVAGALGTRHVTCANCKARIDASALACPLCGHSDTEPLSRR
jgi:serine/threonine protein phosphatase PrpC